MGKTIELAFSSWNLYYKPTATKLKYSVAIHYMAEIDSVPTMDTDRKDFKTREEALAWIDSELESEAQS